MDGSVESARPSAKGAAARRARADASHVEEIEHARGTGCAPFEIAAPAARTRGAIHLRVNALSGELLPPLRVTCGLCGATLYDRVNACLLGPGTQRHIAFELYVDNEPDPSTTVSGAVTRRTCAKRCHATRNQFLLAGRGGCVSTRGFRWAVACGDGLAVCTDVTTGDVLDADALRKAAVEAVQARGDSDEE